MTLYILVATLAHRRSTEAKAISLPMPESVDLVLTLARATAQRNQQVRQGKQLIIIINHHASTHDQPLTACLIPWQHQLRKRLEYGHVDNVVVPSDSSRHECFTESSHFRCRRVSKSSKDPQSRVVVDDDGQSLIR